MLQRGDRDPPSASDGALPTWSGGPVAGHLTCCLQSHSPLFLQRQDSGPRNTWLESWAFSLKGAGLCECWPLEDEACGGEWVKCKSGILVGRLCSSLCPFSQEFYLNFLLPFPFEPLPPGPTPLPSAEGPHLSIC